MASSARFSTHIARCARLRTVCELTLSPSIAVSPTHQADDIGATFVDPSLFSELTSTTGVPKYSILGVSSRFTDLLLGGWRLALCLVNAPAPRRVRFSRQAGGACSSSRSARLISGPPM